MTVPVVTVPMDTVQIGWDGDLTQAAPADFKGVQVYVWRTSDGTGANRTSYVGTLDTIRSRMFWPEAALEVPYSVAFKSVDLIGNVSAPASMEFVLTTGVDSSVEMSWDVSQASSLAGWARVAYGNGRFVAWAYNDKGAVSTDKGVTWREFTFPGMSSIMAITYGGGKFVAVGTSTTGSPPVGDFGASTHSASLVSTDGISWGTRSFMTPADVLIYQNIAYGAGKFLLMIQAALGSIGTEYGLIAYSSDGLNWDLSWDLANGLGWITPAYGAGVFVSATLQGNQLTTVRSVDGVTWTASTAWWAAAGPRSIVYVNGKFILTVAVSWSNYPQPAELDVYSSVDGISWSKIGTNLAFIPHGDWVAGNGFLLALSNLSDQAATRVVTSTNGVAVRDSSGYGSVDEHVLPISGLWTGLAFGDGVFMVVSTVGEMYGSYGGASGAALTSADGVTWEVHYL